MKPSRVAAAAACVALAAAAAAYAVHAGSAAEGAGVRIALLPSVGHAVPIAGIETGIFERHLAAHGGLDARVFGSGTQAVQSILTGRLDAAYVGPGPAVNAYVRSLPPPGAQPGGAAIIVVGGAASGGVSLVARAGLGVSSVADLEGLRVAVPQIANTQDVSLRHALAGAGLGPAERGGSVRVLSVPPPEIYSLLARAGLDAAWVPEPWATLIVEGLGAERVLDEADLWPDGRFATALIVARAGFAESHPGRVAALLAAHDESADWVQENPGGAVDAFASFTERELLVSYPRGALGEAFSRVEFTTDPLRASVAEFASRSAELGYLERGYGADVRGLFAEASR